MIIDNPSPEHLPALRRIWQQAFGDSDSFLDSFYETGFAFERCRCVFLNGSPVAAVYLFDGMWENRKAAYLYALAVEEAHRGQGLSRLLLTDTHAALRREGYGIAILEPATEALRAYYERMGYRLFGSRQEKTVCQGREAVACSRLGCLGYEEKRRQLLPPRRHYPGGRADGVFTDPGRALGRGWLCCCPVPAGAGGAGIFGRCEKTARFSESPESAQSHRPHDRRNPFFHVPEPGRSFGSA